jgi:hypothetical protein
MANVIASNKRFTSWMKVPINEISARPPNRKHKFENGITVLTWNTSKHITYAQARRCKKDQDTDNNQVRSFKK